MQSIERGGYNICHLESMFKVQFLKWAKKYYEENDSSWKFTLRSLFQGINLDILLKSNCADKHIPKCSSFYRAMFLILNGVRHFHHQQMIFIMNKFGTIKMLQ